MEGPRVVRGHSIYEFECICGRVFHLEHPLTFLCPECGRVLVVEARETSREMKSASRTPQTISPEAEYVKTTA